jgi:hypothetical protein
MPGQGGGPDQRAVGEECVRGWLCVCGLLQVVDAQGRVLQADDRINPDLFFAIWGGGGGTYGGLAMLDSSASQGHHGTYFTG